MKMSKRIIGMVLAGAISISMIGCSTTDVKDEIVEIPKIEEPKIEKEESPEFSLALGDGIYQAGVDFEPGIYMLIATRDSLPLGSYEIRDSLDREKMPLDSNAFWSMNYIEILDGEYIQLKNCMMVLETEAREVLAYKGIDYMNSTSLTCGTYVVGKDLMPGTYEIRTTDNSSGWYALEEAIGRKTKLLDCQTFTGFTKITLSEGNVIKLDNNTTLIK